MDEPADPFVCPCCGTDAAKLKMLADYFDLQDAVRGISVGTEVQDDLRTWAEQIEGAKSK